MLHPRARTMLLLSLPAVAIGIASSLILIMVMKIASVLQNLLWQRLPGTLGIAQDSPLWIIGVLTLTGIAVGLVIRFSQGHAGPDPACEPLIGAPIPPSALPGLIVALILGLAGGVSLGPEHPIITVNIALAVAIGARLLPRVNRMEWTILASAGTIGALFGTPVAAALIFSQTLNSSNEVPLWDRLFAPLMAAAAGALTTGLFFHPHFSLPIAHYGQMEMTDILSGAIVAAIAIAAGMVAVWCLPRLHAMMHQMKNPVFVLGIGGSLGLILGLISGLSRWGERLLDTSIQMLRNVPHLALIPLVILWFGIDESAKIFLVALGTLFPIYINTWHGIRNIDRGLVEMARSYGLSGIPLFIHVILPGALPSIMVGVRFALGLMWLTLIVAETISANSGIGYLAMNAREFLQMDVVVVAIILYALLGKLADVSAQLLERLWLRWNPAYHLKEATV